MVSKERKPGVLSTRIKEDWLQTEVDGEMSHGVIERLITREEERNL